MQTFLSPSHARAVLQPVAFTLCLALLLSGCASTRDARSRDNIAKLKTSHLAFIEQFTSGAGKTWDDQALATSTATLEKQFADAEKYESTKNKDPLRKNALSILHSQFKRDAAMLASQKGFFGATFGANLKKKVSQNYDLALKGEDIRS
jgi:hypothetical protein